MASNNIEIESKVLLTKNDYEKILNKLNFGANSIVQTNYYLDSQERALKKYDMVLRIRESNKKYVLTMKAPLAEGLLEKDQNLSQKEADSFIDHNVFPRGDISDFLDILHIPTDSLKILAHMTTERKEVDYQGTTIDISKNSYGEKVDYEVECDSDSALNSQNTLRSICLNLDIDFKLNTLSKETRAINAATAK
ncbi:MAG: CYTH domain-containing protein [Bacilli bacterium]|jgi:uncharacterized protein YjbK